MFIPYIQREMIERSLELWQTSEDHQKVWLEKAEDKIILGTQGRSLIDENKLRNLIRCIRATMKLDFPVTFPMIELGTFKGGSAWCLSKADPSRVLYCLDTFSGHPRDEQAGHKKGDFTSSFEDVQAFLSDCNVELVRGVFPDSGRQVKASNFSLAHIDCDFVTLDMLEWFWRRLVKGGILIIDDYGQEDCPSIKPAVDDFCRKHGVLFYEEERQVIFFKGAEYTAPYLKRSNKTEVLIEQWLSPGDMLGGVVPMVESLHKQFPDKYLTEIRGTCVDAIFAGSPYQTKLSAPEHKVVAHYDVSGSHDRSFSFVQAHCDHLTSALKLPQPLINQTRRPSLYLTDEERKPIRGKTKEYVVGTFGYKTDCDIKGKGSHLLWRDAVEFLNSKNIAVIQVGEKNKDHIHDPIPGAIYMVGKTTTRELIRLVSQSIATMSSISFVTHISAAFDIPNICVTSRENLDFAMYRTTISLNCIGLLPCCSGSAAGGCWKNTLDLPNRTDVCSLPVLQEDNTLVPGCTNIIRQSGALISELRKILLTRGLY